MKTIEDTPFGRFEIYWGVDEVREIERRFGSFDHFKDEHQYLRLKEPLYGELKTLTVYRHTTNSHWIVLLGEITNCVWANGFLIDGIDQ